MRPLCNCYYGSSNRAILRTSALFVAFLLTGCAAAPDVDRSPRPMSESKRRDIRELEVRSVVVSDARRLREPWAKSQAGGKGAAQGALIGAAGGTLAMVWGAPESMGLSLFLVPVAAPVGAVIGAVSGSRSGLASAPPDDQLARDRQVLIERLSRATVADDVAAHVTTGVMRETHVVLCGAGATRGPLSGSGQAPHVLRLQLLRWGLVGPNEANPDLLLVVELRAELLNSRGRPVYSSRYAAQRGPRKFHDWAALSEAELRMMLGQMSQDLGQRVVDETLLLHVDVAPPRLLAPADPSGSANGADVRTLYPDFRWEPFPSDQQLRRLGVERSRVGNVSYDLRIVRPNPDTPLLTIRRLPTAEHRLQEPLQPWAGYRWTVRARFEIDGHARMTPWSELGWSRTFEARRPAGRLFVRVMP